MTRFIAASILVSLAAAGCTFDAGSGGYVFKPPKDTEPAEDTVAPPVELGTACLEWFGCILTISTQGGSVGECSAAAPAELEPYLDALQVCRASACNDLTYDPESGSFVPVAFRNCLKYNCPDQLLSCLAHGQNQSGCKKYVVCEQGCDDGQGVLCDLNCMKSLAQDDVPDTVDYLSCMKDFATIPEGGGITDKLCECLGICEVSYPVCADAPRGR
ncbi:MAG: hypothetical protein FJ098_06630 [Deltaproteobacteria bacterium]|nr:hypothetical protein [Deltaproteobacteria bacterium]